MRKCVYIIWQLLKRKRLWGVFDTLFRTSHFSPQYFSLTTHSSAQHSFIHTNIPRGVFHKILNCMNQCIMHTVRARILKTEYSDAIRFISVPVLPRMQLQHSLVLRLVLAVLRIPLLYSSDESACRHTLRPRQVPEDAHLPRCIVPQIAFLVVL